jgi:hypothetical protein
MTFLLYAGDFLWIIALTVMAGAARQAWGRMDADTLVPMQFKPDGSPGYRAKRAVALCALPALAFVVSLLLVVRNRNVGLTGDAALILFGVRATLAGLFPLAYLRWMKPAMATLEAEGALKPQG